MSGTRDSELTCEQIAEAYPDDNEVPDDARADLTNRYWRHFMFAKFVLGESLKDAYFIAYKFRKTPLPLAAMHHLADHWHDEDYDGPTALQVAGVEPESPDSGREAHQ